MLARTRGGVKRAPRFDCPRRRCYGPAIVRRSLPARILRWLAGGALAAAAAAGCAPDESARRAVAEVASMQAQVATMRGVQDEHTRELTALQSRLRGLEAETTALTREVRSATSELDRARAALGETQAERPRPEAPARGGRQRPER